MLIESPGALRDPGLSLQFLRDCQPRVEHPFGLIAAIPLGLKQSVWNTKAPHGARCYDPFRVENLMLIEPPGSQRDPGLIAAIPLD